MAVEPDSVAKAQRDESSGLAVPDGKGGFTNPDDKSNYPQCPICRNPFEAGDTMIQVCMVIGPGKLTVSQGHLACALSMLQARIRAAHEGAKVGMPREAPKQDQEPIQTHCKQHIGGCPQGSHPQELVLVEEDGVPPGYFEDVLESTMDEVTLKRWREWFRGQTGAIVQGRMLVYAHDWERFQRGLEASD